MGRTLGNNVTGLQGDKVNKIHEALLWLQNLTEEEVMNRFDNLLNRLAWKNMAYSEEEVAADVEAARDELSKKYDIG
jgi:hypothetical protein